MSDTETDLVLDWVIDAPPQTVWRALSVPAYLERWLLSDDSRAALGVEGLELDLLAADPGRSLTYRWREVPGTGMAGAEDSLVTFVVTPCPGGTRLVLTHAAPQTLVPANTNTPMACAA